MKRTNDQYTVGVEVPLDDGSIALLQGIVLAGTNGVPVNLTGTSGTGAFTQVASGITSVQILAASSTRKGATITNTDANILYVMLAATAASVTNHTAPIAPNAYYEVPFGYTGVINGIWAADGAGNANVTSFS
jgi:hypothetical protein